MAYYKRIGDNDMTSEFVDGSVLLHTDMNEIETLTKTGINANYEDIQKLQDGTLTVQTAVNATNAVNATTASQLSGATLSKYTDEDLQDSDTKIPTSKQVKEYVDSIDVDMDYEEALNKPSINGVTLIGNKTTSDLHIDVDVPFYYWNGLNTADNVAMFNEICDKYTNGEKFVLVGKVALENGYTYNGTFYERTIDVVVPFSVKDFTEYEGTDETGHSVFSFMTEPVRTTSGYAVGSVDLTGYAWGEFTAVSPITWSYSEGPAMSGNTINVVTSLPAADYTTVGKVYQYMGATNVNYTNGYFYTCVQTGQSTYAWTQLNVQPIENPVPEDIIFITADNSTIINSGDNYTITNEKLHNAITNNVAFKLLFVNTGTSLDTLSMSFDEINLGSDTYSISFQDTSGSSVYYTLEATGSNNVVDLTFDGRFVYSEEFQKYEMPTANADNEGYIYQYVGMTGANYTNGYFYKSVAQGTTPETYAWEAIEVQAGGGGGGSSEPSILPIDITITETEIGFAFNNATCTTGANIEQDLIDILNIRAKDKPCLGQYTWRDNSYWVKTFLLNFNIETKGSSSVTIDITNVNYYEPYRSKGRQSTESALRPLGKMNAKCYVRRSEWDAGEITHVYQDPSFTNVMTSGLTWNMDFSLNSVDTSGYITPLANNAFSYYTDYDYSKSQYFVHDANNASYKWEDKPMNIIVLTESEYNALTTYADNTEYHIIEG